MIELELTKEQFDELHREASKNPVERARRKCWVVYLRGRGISRKEVSSIVRVDEDTVTEYVRKYVEGGLSCCSLMTIGSQRVGLMITLST